MEHDYEPTTNVCLRCFLTKAEANVYDPPAMCGAGITPTDNIAEARKKKLVVARLYREPAEPPPPEE